MRWKIFDYLIGFGLLAKGWDKAENFSHYPLRIIFIFLAGLLVIAGATFQRRLERRIRNFHAFFHLLEGLVLVASASIFLEKGKHWIPAITAFIGIVYLAIGATQLLAVGQNREKTLQRLGKGIGIAFLAAAVITAAVAILFDPKFVVFVTAAIFALAGVFNLFISRRLRKKSGGSHS